MSALDDLKDRIDSAIYTNTEQNITGDGLQTVLDDMVDTMGVSVSQNTSTGEIAQALSIGNKTFNLKDYEVGNKAKTITISDYANIIWNGTEVAASTDLYNGIVLRISDGVKYSWNTSEENTPRVFDHFPVIGDTDGRNVTSGFTAQSGDMYLLITIGVSVTSIAFSESNTGIFEDVANLQQNVINANMPFLRLPNNNDLSTYKIDKAVISIKALQYLSSDIKLGCLSIRTTYNDINIEFKDSNNTIISSYYSDTIDITSNTPIKCITTGTLSFELYIVPSEVERVTDFKDLAPYNIWLNNSYLNALLDVNKTLSDYQQDFINSNILYLKKPLNKDISSYKIDKAILDIKSLGLIDIDIKFSCCSARENIGDLYIEFKNTSGTTVSSFYSDTIDLMGNIPIKCVATGTYTLEMYIIPSQIEKGSSFTDLTSFNIWLNNHYLNAHSLSTNFISGKNVVCFGDSITMFKGTEDSKSYSDWLNTLGVNAKNCGFGGAQITARTTPVTTPTSATEAMAAFDLVNLIGAICDNDYTKLDAALAYIVEHDTEWISSQFTANLNRIKAIKWNDVDVVTLFAGTNDFSEGVTIGNADDNVGTTIRGAINIITSTLLTRYPKIKIYWFTPIVRYTSNERIAANWCDNSLLPNYVTAIQEQAKKNHLAVCDLYHKLGWNQYNFSQYFIDEDNVHPFKGFRDIATMFIKFINAN